MRPAAEASPGYAIAHRPTTVQAPRGTAGDWQAACFAALGVARAAQIGPSQSGLAGPSGGGAMLRAPWLMRPMVRCNMDRRK